MSRALACDKCAANAEGTFSRFFPLSGSNAEARGLEMTEAGQPRMVPFGADQTLFVIIDRAAGNKEVRVERPDFESALRDLIAGCFNDPVRVIAFNTLEHWVRDVSADAAAEIQARCDIEGDRLPDHIRDFVEIHVCAAARATGAAAPLPADAI